MTFPETWISIEIQLSLHYLVNPSPDLNAEDQKKQEILLYTPISSQIRQVPTPIPNPHKIQDQYFLKTRAGGDQFIFHTFLTYFFTGSWDVHDKVRLEKLVPLLRISLGDLPIGPFGGRKQFSTQPNGQIQDWGFPSGARKKR